MKHLDNNSTNPPQYSIGELLDDYTYESEFDYYDPITKKSYTGKDGKKHLEQAINQLIYTQVLELIPEKVDMKQVSYQKDIQPQYYVAGFNQAIDDMTERIKAKYIGGSDDKI